MFRRPWVRIPVPYTGWSKQIFVVRIAMFVKDKNKLKRGRGWPIFFKKTMPLTQYVLSENLSNKLEVKFTKRYENGAGVQMISSLRRTPSLMDRG